MAFEFYMHFFPPNEGLELGETVIWARKKGVNFWVVFFGFIVMIGSPLLLFNTFQFGEFFFGGLLFILSMIGIFLILREFLRGIRTKYYLTNKRILEVRKGAIIQQVSLERFEGKPLNQFFEKRITHRVNQQPIYTIRIYDPQSGDALIDLRDLDGTSTTALEQIGQTIRCSYCDAKNIAITTQCHYCGGPL
jgi:hypothetical protein